jgi:PleD family two-component response regulator
MSPTVRPRILVADDDRPTRHTLARAIEASGWEPLPVGTGDDALAALSAPDGPRIAVLDWIMPGIDGVEVCRRVRQLGRDVQPYLIMATVRDETSEIVVALDAGADDYVVKPVDARELQARVRVGLRMVGLQEALTTRVSELKEALSHVKELRGLLPICAYCKRIRDDHNYWQSVEEYLTLHTDLSFSHGFCPSCVRERLEPQLVDSSAPQS